MRTLLFSSLVLLSVDAWGAIAIDSYTISGVGSTQITWSHPCTGCNFIVVGVVSSANANVTISSVSYGGNLLTEVVASTNASGVTQSSLWYLSNPPTGTNTVKVNTTDTVWTIAGGAISFSGVDTSNAVDCSSSTLTNNPPYTMSLACTTAVNNDWMVDCAINNNTSVLTSVSGTSRWANNNFGGSSFGGFGSTKGPVSTGSNSMGYSDGAQNQEGMVLMAIEPATSSPCPSMNMLGVGCN